MRGIVRVEDRDRQVVAIDDFDRSDDEGVLRGEELVPAPVPRRNFVENAVSDESAENLPKGRNRGQRFRAIAARVDDFQGVDACPSSKLIRARRGGGFVALDDRGKKPFALTG